MPREVVVVRRVVAVGSERIDFNEVDPGGPRGSRVCDFFKSRGTRVLPCFPREIVAGDVVELAVVQAVGAAGLRSVTAAGVGGSRA